MALIDWHEDAWRLFNEHVDRAYYEFGRKTGEKWLKEMAVVDSRLRNYPESSTHCGLMGHYSKSPSLKMENIVVY